MKNVTFLLLTIFRFFRQDSHHAQGVSAGTPPPAVNKPFSNCAAAFLNNKMLVNDYSPNGRCIVEEGVKGN
ncbi:MAG: hypothetical protein R2788_15060 [Saprospiraceae bacterium]